MLLSQKYTIFLEVLAYYYLRSMLLSHKYFIIPDVYGPID